MGENGVELSSKVLNGSKVGSCAVIGKNDKFNCSVKFGTPPIDITSLGDFDRSAPAYTTTCSSKNSIKDLKYIPSWLEKQCIENYGDPSIIRRPITTAAFTGEKARLHCTTKSFNEYGAVLWSVISSNGNAIPLTYQDVISPDYGNIYDTEDKWDLIVNNVNENTTGLYECYAYDLGLNVLYDAYLVEMSTYN